MCQRVALSLISSLSSSFVTPLSLLNHLSTCIHVCPCLSMSVYVCLCLSACLSIVCLPLHCLPACAYAVLASKMREILLELTILVRLRHPNIVTFWGTSTEVVSVCVCVCVCKQPVVRTNRFFTLIRSIRFSTNSFSLISSLIFSMRSHTQRTNPFSTSGQPL